MPGPALARSKKINRWETTRVYSIDGTDYPSVTSIIGMADKPALVGWAAKMAAAYAVENREAIALLDDEDATALISRNWRKQRDRAASFGSAVHEFIEEGVTPDDERMAAYVASAQAYLADNISKVISQEVTCVNVDEGYAGTFDFLALDGTDLVIGDWKSGKGLYFDSHALQLVALANATHTVADTGELTPITETPTVGHAVRLSATSYELRTIEIASPAASAAQRSFVGLIDVWRLKMGGHTWTQ